MSFENSSSEEESDQEYPRKRRKQTKEDRMLGVFGSDSEDDSTNRLSRKTLHTRPLAFQKHQTSNSEEERDSSEDERAFLSFRLQGREKDDLTKKSMQTASDSHVERHEIKPAPRFGTFASDVLGEAASANKTTQTASISGPQVKARSEATIAPHEAAAALKLQGGKAAKMMARMGYKAGEGLGASGGGIVAPIEAKLRSGQKAGLGSMGEIAAPDRMENTSRGTRARNKLQSKRAAEGARNPEVIRLKTAQEIVAEAGGGLSIPKTLQAIVNMTETQPKLITDVENGISSSATMNDEKQRMSLVARKQVERSATKWRTLQDQKDYYTMESRRVENELESARTALGAWEIFSSCASALISSSDQLTDDETIINRAIDESDKLEELCRSSIPGSFSEELVVAIVAPVLKRAISSWLVLDEPKNFLAALLRLRKLHDDRILVKQSNIQDDRRRQSSPYESLMTTIWFHRVRSALQEPWSNIQGDKVLNFLEMWADAMPKSLHDQVKRQIVMPQLLSIVQGIHFKQPSALYGPLQWVSYLGDSASELINALLLKFSTNITRWKLSEGLIPGLSLWAEALGSQKIQDILECRLMPRLAEMLRTELVIEFSDQNRNILDNVLAWQAVFKLTDMAELIQLELFPRWLKFLYSWLKNEPDFEKVGEWYEWWWEQAFSPELREMPQIQECFNQGLRMMDVRLEHGADAMIPPKVGPAKPLDHAAHKANKNRAAVKNHVISDLPEVTFKDVVEEWCAKHNYLLRPLREAHTTGNALYKVTGDSTNAGGAVIYLRGDIIMMQSPEKTVYQPTSFSELAVAVG